MISDDTISNSALNHVVRNVGSAAIDKGADDGIVPVKLGDRFQPVLVQKALDLNAVDFLPHTAVEAINEVFDLGTTRQGCTAQVTQHIVAVGGGLPTCGFAEE